MSDFDHAQLNEMLSKTLSQYAPMGRTALLPALQAAQALYGHISETVATEISKQLDTPLVDVHGVIEFYSMLYNQPVGRRIIRVCTDPACEMKGGEEALETLCQSLQIAPGQTTLDREYTVERAACLGLCEHAPAALVDQTPLAPVEPGKAAQLCQAQGMRPSAKVYGTHRLLTANCGRGAATRLAAYQAHGGYQGLRRALGITPEQVIDEVKQSGLVGRGGAAFPTGIKWEGARGAAGETRYVVCNADESEPGTFKDRVLMEDDPHLILEGLMIAGYAIGARKGYIYVRGEYPLAYQALEAAIEEARHAALLDHFEIELRRGAGAYICGEETALFESIEGKRGYPRLKPPFPTTHGLFGQPTAINNVETLGNIPRILREGAAEFRRLGTDQSPGTKLFCLSGDVARPGLYEAPFGIRLHELIYDLAGGPAGGKALQTVLLGGAAGAFVPPNMLDVRMSFEDMRQAGLPLGSGVVMVLDESRDLRRFLLGLGRFFAHESCGKCLPCQIGTQRQVEILRRASQGRLLPGDVERLEDVGWTMSDASICGLGQTAASATLSALKLWPELFTPSPGASHE